MLSRLLSCAISSLFLCCSSSIGAITADEFKAVYDSLQRQTLDRSGEVAEIDSFTYVKDVATFHFGKGTMLLQRPVHGRPTLAAFIGTGQIRIDILPTVEQLTLDYSKITSAVQDTFHLFVARIGDDFDLAIKSRFHFVPGLMATADYRHIADFQGPLFFNTPVRHAMSVFERTESGFFWADTDPCRFTFDPYASEQIEVYRRNETKRGAGLSGASFQSKNRGRYETEQLSQLDYSVTPAEFRGTYNMGGANGWTIKAAAMDFSVTVNSDSLRFVEFDLDRHFIPDSLTCNGRPISHFRRSEFDNVVFILDSYAYSNDTLAFSLWFHNGGDMYGYHALRTEDPVAFSNVIDLIYPKGYNYAIPFACPVTDVGNDQYQCVTKPVNSWYHWFQALATGYDTSTLSVDDKISVTMIYTSYFKHLKKELPKEVVESFRYFLGNYGLPSGVDDWFVFPGGRGVSPGLLRIPVTKGENNLGGLHHVVGTSVASAWFGPSLSLASYRENWMRSAIPQYLGMMYVQSTAGNNPMYTILASHKQTVANLIDDRADYPIAVSGRSYFTHGGSKGQWLLHMLRVLYFDVEKMSDAKFIAFIKDVVAQANDSRFSNNDLCRLAEQHFGSTLDWFFEPWLYKRGFPSFDVAWKSVGDGENNFIDLHVVTTDVDSENVYPVMLRVTVPSGSALMRQAIAGSKQDYRIGPFPEPPTDLKFNEYESVLCKSKVRKL